MGTWKIPLPNWSTPTGSTIWSSGDSGGAVLSAAFGGIGTAPVSGSIAGPFPGTATALYLDGSGSPTNFSALPSGWTPDGAYTFRWRTLCTGATDTIAITLTSIGQTVNHNGPDGGELDIDSPLTGCTLPILVGIATSTITVAMVSVTGFGPFFGVQDVLPVPTGTWFSGTYTTSAPVVTRVNPSSGSVNGGQTVTITGEGFTGATAVKFNGVSVTFTPTSDTSGTATTPPGTVGTVDVEVVGIATLTGGYTYVLPSLKLPPFPGRVPVLQGGGPRRGR